MNEYRFTHLDNRKNAVGCPVIITKGEYKGKKGIVTNVMKSITDQYGYAYEITLNHGEYECPVCLYSGDHFDSLFTVDIRPNGFAYHYDCGMNILKEWKEETVIYGGMD